MKKKYFILLLAVAFIFASSVGGALWIILSENQVGISLYEKKDVTVSVTIDPIYYGNEIALGATTATYGGAPVEGTWSIVKDDNKETYVASGELTDGLLKTDAIVTAVFTPENKMLYNVAEKQLTVPMHPVALYGTTYYSRLDDALTDANQAANGGTVYALALGKTVEDIDAREAKTISKVTAIDSNVTLFLPYTEGLEPSDTVYGKIAPKDNDGDNNPDEPTGTEDYDFSMFDFEPATYKTNQIYIASGRTLTNNGTVIVGGEVSGGNGGGKVNSMTAGRHGQINLVGSAQIVNNSKLTCYGYIAGGTNSRVTAKSGSETTVIFTVVENRGGSTFFGMLIYEDDGYGTASQNQTVLRNIADAALAGLNNISDYYPDNMSASPFNRFYVESLITNLTVEYGACVYGYTNLYANNEHNETSVNLIGPNNDAKDYLLEFASNARLDANYTYKDGDDVIKKHTFDFFGDISLNSLSVTITVSKEAAGQTVTMRVHVDTTTTYFPISHHFDVTFNPGTNGSATVDLRNQPKIKLLPGAVVNIEEGVTAKANNLVVYGEGKNSLIHKDTMYIYSESAAAQLNVAGTLEVSNFGGEVKAESESAVFKISEANQVISKEMRAVDLHAPDVEIPVLGLVPIPMSCSAITYYPDSDCTFIANGKTITNQNGATLSANTYYSANIGDGNGGDNFVWYSTPYDITVNNWYNGSGVFESSHIITMTTPGGFDTVPQSDYYYSFSHYCNDLNCENTSSDCPNRVTGKLYASTTVKAVWVENEYEVRYVYDSNEGYLVEGEILYDKLKFTSEHYSSALPMLEGNMEEGFVFVGWKTSRGVSVTSYKDVAIFASATNNVITLTAEFTQKETFRLILDYGDHDTDADNYEWRKEGRVYDGAYLPVIDSDRFDADVTQPDYFAGWSFDGVTVLDGVITQALLDEYLVTDGEGNLTLTLVAVWGKKLVLSFSVSYPANSNATPVEEIDAIYLLRGQKFSNLGDYSTLFAANDANPDVTSYFTGWRVQSGDATLTGNSITIETSTVIEALFANKFKLTFDVNSGAAGNVYPTEITDTIYLRTTDSYALPQLTDKDDDTTVSMYFNGWAIANGDGLVNGATISSLRADTRVQAQWGAKHKVTLQARGSYCSSVTLNGKSINAGNSQYFKPGKVKVIATANSAFLNRRAITLDINGQKWTNASLDLIIQFNNATIETEIEAVPGTESIINVTNGHNN